MKFQTLDETRDYIAGSRTRTGRACVVAANRERIFTAGRRLNTIAVARGPARLTFMRSRRRYTSGAAAFSIIGTASVRENVRIPGRRG